MLLACLIVGSITAINNYKKELQFRSLQEKQDDAHVTLWRNGEVVQAPVNEVCVGDVVQLDTGAKIPAGMMSMNQFREQSSYTTTFNLHCRRWYPDKM